MSQIFDIVEELEKERQKNKELQKRVDFLIDRNDKKQDRIDKAVDYIEHLDNVFIDSKEQDNIVDILKGDNK